MSELERAQLAEAYAMKCRILNRARQAYLRTPEGSPDWPRAQSNLLEASAHADQAFLALMSKVTDDAQR